MKQLPWDSEFFGYTVAKVTSPTTLSELKQAGVRLAYVSVSADTDTPSWVNALHGKLVDTKTTYAMKLSGDYVVSADVIEYSGQMTEQLNALAIQAGAHSRFKVDTQIGYDNFVKLYQLWLSKSLTHELAKVVMVTPQQSGFITVGEKNGRSDIGLLAVDTSARGKGYGEALVRAAQHWSVQHGYAYSQVVTQGDNVAASRLYEKCGYQVESRDLVYHVWVN